MADERLAKDSTALDEATDRVIREMTQVHLSDDAVARVMARVRTARGAAIGADSAVRGASGRGWFGALLEPRVSWGGAAVAAALAAIVAVGATLAAVRGTRDQRIGSGDVNGGTRVASAAPLSPAAPAAAAANAATAVHAAAPNVAEKAPSRAAVSVPRALGSVPVARVHRTHGASAVPGAGGDETVRATILATPDEETLDEEPARAQQPAAGADRVGATGAAAVPVPQDIKLDVTITDQAGTTKPIAKTVSMVIADRESGSIRSETRVPFQQQPIQPGGAAAPIERWETENLPLNVDAWPIILPDGHIRVKLSLNYRTASQHQRASNEPLATASVTKNIIAVLSDGKPLIVSESADAATDRKVAVQLKATIQK